MCSEDTAPREDHEIALNEIALFVYDERLHCAGSDNRDYLLQQGHPASRVTFFGEQYDRLLQGLQRDNRQSAGSAQSMGERGDHQKGIEK